MLHVHFSLPPAPSITALNTEVEMRPRATGRDATDGLLGDSVMCRDELNRFIDLDSLGDFVNLRLGKAGHTVLGSPERNLHAGVDSVPCVLAGRDYLKVLGPVVRLNAVDVVDLGAGRDRADERGHNETVNVTLLWLRSVVKLDAVITEFGGLELKQTPMPMLKDRKHSTDLTNPRDLVTSFVSDNGTPLLFHNKGLYPIDMPQGVQ